MIKIGGDKSQEVCECASFIGLSHGNFTELLHSEDSQKEISLDDIKKIFEGIRNKETCINPQLVKKELQIYDETVIEKRGNTNEEGLKMELIHLLEGMTSSLLDKENKNNICSLIKGED